MIRKYLFLLFFIMFIISCKKNKPNATGEFVSYFEDTSAKYTGASFPEDSIISKILKITDIDTGFLPNLRWPGVPAAYEIEMPAVGDQGKLNSCVGWAAAYGAFSYHIKIKQAQNNYTSNNLMSPVFVWNKLNGGRNDGIPIPFAMKLIKMTGTCKYESMPYSLSFSTYPNQMQFDEAKNFKSDDFVTISSVEDLELLKFVISIKKMPLIFSIKVDSGFITGTVSNSFRRIADNRLIWKEYDNSPKGNHAMVICGYDDNINAFKVLNSWGNKWGNSGYIWIDYNFFKKNITKSDLGFADIYFFIVRQAGDKNKGLVAYYPFNNNSIDASGNGNHGTVYGATLTTDRHGNPNKAYSFDGVDDYIVAANSTSLDIQGNEMSISMWINYENDVSDPNFFGLSKGGVHVGNGYELLIRGSYGGDNGIVSFNYEHGTDWDFTSYSNANSCRGQWMHLVAVLKSGVGKLYLNNKEVSQNTEQSFNLSSSNSQLFIGRRNPDNIWATFLKGKIDDIRIYKRVLSESEINTLFQE